MVKMAKNIEKNVSDSLDEIFREFTLISIYGTLEEDNNVDKIPLSYPKKEEQEVINLCDEFEKKYNKKLKYTFEKGLCYISY